MRHVVKLTRGCGCFIIICLTAGLAFCIMQKTTIGFYIALTGMLLLFPYMFLGLCVACVISGEKEKQNKNTDKESSSMAVIAACQISREINGK